MPQRVLITAGAGGIGLAIARAFAAGALVHIADGPSAEQDADGLHAHRDG
jgi:NAD(P)-dependent dehydrogenase (short-subunit alcohol dehydrogenase family)